MTRAEIVAALQALERARAERVEVWIEVVEADGTPAERIFKGSFPLPHDPHPREPHSGG